MKVIGFAVLAVAMSMSGISLAGQRGPSGQRVKKPIVVTAQRASVREWSQTASRTLSDTMRYPATVLGFAPESGLATVRFKCDDAGHPVDVTLATTSGKRHIDGAALRAVSRIRSLPPMPAGLTADQVVEANLIFAVSQPDFDRLTAEASDRARQRLALKGGGDQVAALNITSAASAISQ